MDSFLHRHEEVGLEVIPGTTAKVVSIAQQAQGEQLPWWPSQVLGQTFMSGSATAAAHCQNASKLTLLDDSVGSTGRT